MPEPTRTIVAPPRVAEPPARVASARAVVVRPEAIRPGPESSPKSDDAEHRLFAMSVAPRLTPATRAVEIGPGAGRWTVQLAPLVRDLVVVDVAPEMIDRTRTRTRAAEMTNVAFVLGSGGDLAPIGTGSVDFVFAYDVFVWIPLEPTVAYLADIARVLRDDGIAVIQHAVNDVRPAWERLDAGSGGAPAAAGDGAYCYHSRDALDRMYARFGLRIESVWTEHDTAVITARKPADSIVPRLEQILRQAAAPGEEAGGRAAGELAGLAEDLRDRVAALAARLALSAEAERAQVIQQIRRLIRG